MASENITTHLVFKRLLLAGLFCFFFFLLAQQLFKFKNIKELRGDIVPAEYAPFSAHSWFAGTYQDSTNNFLNEDFGFRNYFLRLNNQLDFWLFHKANTKEMVIGEDNFLYVQGYINGYYGLDYIGQQAIADTVANLKDLQSTLQSMGKTLLVVLAPSKTRIYPEHLPAQLPRKGSDVSNYSEFVKEFDRNGINYIDFNTLYKHKKDTVKYMLFPQLGVHWSRLEGVYAADTILGKLSQLSGTSLPRIKVTKIVEQNYLERPDEDAIEGMNVFTYPPFIKMAYPETELITEGRVTKNVLVIGDSFWWDIYLKQIPRYCFAINNFWYYNRDDWGNNFSFKKPVANEDIKRTLLQFDMVIIINTESNYGLLGFGFIGAAAHAIKRPIYPTAGEFAEIRNSIIENNTWMEQVRAKAIAKNISVDSAVNMDVRWMFNHNGPPIKKYTFEGLVKSIRSNKDWMASIGQQAKDKKISLDSMVMETANWYFDTQFTSEEKVSRKMDLDQIRFKIRQNPEWLKQITEKAKERKLPLDSMITLDALWYQKQTAR